MITLEKVAAVVAEQRRDAAYQAMLLAQSDYLRCKQQHIAALKELEKCSI